MRPTQAVIQLGNYAHNLREIRAHAHADALLMPVVKSNAYGHGLVPMAHKALECGASMLAVAIAEEAATLREAGVVSPILVLGGILPQTVPLVIEYGLQQTVFDLERLEAIAVNARAARKQAAVHIKVDTGMNRIGVKRMDVFDKMLNMLQTHTHVRLEGLYTHFATSDESDKSFANEQFALFMRFVQRARERGFKPLLHAANSGAVCDLPETHLDIIRPGIISYGYYPSPHVKKDIVLRPVMRLITSVVDVKDIAAGESVSYGATFTAQRETRVATLPIGYGDGYHRAMSGKAQVLIHGKHAPVIGTICMDQLMIDVTDIHDVGLGDEAVLIGAQGAEVITADDLASWSRTINYEVLLSITERVPRVYSDES